MAYADLSYYKNTFRGNKIADESLLERASDQIDSLTFNRINGVGFNSLTPFQQDKIKKAVCIQAEFIEQYGEYIDMPLSGYSVGDVSLSFTGSVINGVTTTKEVLGYLKQTGLTSRRL
ncbi:hypothetical protein [Clostridium polynesiense]|uniref:hypothetical protein n=1 Tax=Clostridium polynesiense TaxID=1325933 RepID=UPI00058D325D|nr:hypothetical protein [Clostridium polynesiense]